MPDKRSIKLLKYIRKKRNVSDKMIEKKYHSSMTEELSLLQNNGLIRWETDHSDAKSYRDFLLGGTHTYQITAEGRGVLEDLLSEKLYRLYPYVISTIALILSVFNTLKVYGIL